MDCEKFEVIMSRHCSPVLMGQKPANLVSFSKEKMPDFPELFQFYKEKFSAKGIFMKVICGCRKHYLVFVYRKDMLERYLEQKEARELLIQDGYSEEANLDEWILHLKERFEMQKEFPHEIGLFLGYPLEDVKGFRLHGGSGCKLCGYWKVYGDVEKAKLQFAIYDKCREFMNRQICQGYSILQIIERNERCAQKSA